MARCSFRADTTCAWAASPVRSVATTFGFSDLARSGRRGETMRLPHRGIAGQPSAPSQNSIALHPGRLICFAMEGTLKTVSRWGSSARIEGRWLTIGRQLERKGGAWLAPGPAMKLKQRLSSVRGDRRHRHRHRHRSVLRAAWRRSP